MILLGSRTFVPFLGIRAEVGQPTEIGFEESGGIIEGLFEGRGRSAAIGMVFPLLYRLFIWQVWLGACARHEPTYPLIYLPTSLPACLPVCLPVCLDPLNSQ